MDISRIRIKIRPNLIIHIVANNHLTTCASSVNDNSTRSTKDAARAVPGEISYFLRSIYDQIIGINLISQYLSGQQ